MIEITREEVEKQKSLFEIVPWGRDEYPDLKLLELKWEGTKKPGKAEAAAITVAKWEIVRDHEGTICHSGGCSTCGFCLRYVSACCMDCPVMAHTGKSYCSNVVVHVEYEDTFYYDVERRKHLIESIFLTLNSIVKVVERKE